MKPYNSKEPKKKQVARMFNAIAPSYDKLNHLLSFNIDKKWRQKLVSLVLKVKPEKIVDIATGTGDLAIALNKAVPETKICGVDLSEGMLKMAKEKVKNLGLEQAINFEKGDAENLPFENESFQVATVAFGVRNFQNLQAGISEAFRVLEKGGHFFVLEFSTPRNKLFRVIYQFYFHKILPLIGRIISKDKKAYTYLPLSVDEFPTADEFLKMLKKSGFTQCNYKSLLNGVAYIYIGVKENENKAE